MKPQLLILLALLGTPLAFAEEKHDHDHDSKEEHADHDHDHDHDEDEHDHGKKGPNGGHVVESKAGFAFEVSVDKERKARVVFLDEDLKPIALKGHSLTGIAGERSAPVKLAFTAGEEADKDVLISDKPLPAGAHVAMILRIIPGAEGKAVTERFELHLH